MRDPKLPSPLDGHPWTRFVAIGDSITEGYGMDPVEGVEHVPWVERVARALAAGRPDFEFHNLGWRNLRAAEVRDSQLERALELEPDLVSIAAGPNDLIAPELDRDQLERDMEPMYAAFAERGTFVFTFMYMDFPSAGLVPEDGAAFIRERMELLHDAVLALSERHGALVVDLYNDPRTADPGFFSEDLKHANAAGQAYVAEQTLRALGGALDSGRARGRAASG
jgi:lysophospholipase L1-like esterase